MSGKKQKQSNVSRRSDGKCSGGEKGFGASGANAQGGGGACAKSPPPSETIHCAPVKSGAVETLSVLDLLDRERASWGIDQASPEFHEKKSAAPAPAVWETETMPLALPAPVEAGGSAASECEGVAAEAAARDALECEEERRRLALADVMARGVSAFALAKVLGYERQRVVRAVKKAGGSDAIMRDEAGMLWVAPAGFRAVGKNLGVSVNVIQLLVKNPPPLFSMRAGWYVAEVCAMPANRQALHCEKRGCETDGARVVVRVRDSRDFHVGDEIVVRGTEAVYGV